MIKTKVGNVIDTMAALEEIRGQRMPKGKAKELFFLRKAMEPSQEFFQEQQKEIIEKIGLKISGDGKIDLSDPEKRRKYMEEIRELRGLEAKIEAEPLDLSEIDVEVSEMFMGATEGIVII